MKRKAKINVLFVCMGNICRSPTAEAVFTRLVQDENVAHAFNIDSAGTHAYHVGEQPDFRSQQEAKSRGIDMSRQRARKFVMGDFEDFDYILAMDDENYSVLMNACPEQFGHKVQYFLDYAPHVNTREVPDPYYGGKYGFEKVFNLVEEASAGFLNYLQEKGKLK